MSRWKGKKMEKKSLCEAVSEIYFHTGIAVRIKKPPF